MPVVLVLFCLALGITSLGLFLSPNAQNRRTSNEYSAPPTKNPINFASKSRFGEHMNSWKVIVPGFLVIVVLGFFLLNVSQPRPLLWVAAFFGAGNAQPTPGPSTPTLSPVSMASQHLVRLNQLSVSEYRSMQEYNTWAYSACSAAAMSEVINAYGHHYRVTDILAIESKVHAITPELGLLDESGIERTGVQFGFKTTWGHTLSLDQVIATANRGAPVIVGFPPSVAIPGGHILVVRGGNANTVFLTDSSLRNWTQLTRSRFLQLWRGFSAIMTPN